MLGLVFAAATLVLDGKKGTGREGAVAFGADPTADPTAGPGTATPSPWSASTLEGEAARPSATAVNPGAAAVNRVPEADRRAGITHLKLLQRGTGRLHVVPGSMRAPKPSPFMRVRVEVEEGIGVDGKAFAAFVMNTLNDRRGWGRGGRLSFARTDGKADFRVILASPQTSAQLCAPERTRGTMSCGGGEKAVITMHRWLNGIPDYGKNRTGYRQYIINHEVGHVLGHGHAYCDPGHLAPVMVQQTKGLRGCLPNSWPFPSS